MATLDARTDADLVLPVTNESWMEETRRAPAVAYSTPTGLARAAERTAESPDPAFAVGAPRAPVFGVRRSVLAALPADLPLDEAPEAIAAAGGRAVADPGAYLHRYAEMDAQARGDLAARLPEGSRSVLDVGCSRGATAQALRLRDIARIVGIEPDPGDAAEAALVYDRVLARPLEAVPEDEFAAEFDGVLFGDVLEHLVDPSDALVRVRPWLSTAGVVVASVPNLGNWAIVADLLAGRFDYVPYSILSGTHVRHFTRRTIGDLFEATGYRVESIDTVTLPVSPEDAARIDLLSRWPGASDDLAAAEFIVVARPAA
ncbi:MAG TPA: class I SAM-dependent methyltransferase [Thermoanaerobaculia bacterium]|nr:class I SAM-dependent methyltransferase [Thermoanaerobaculia bacterium]